MAKHLQKVRHETSFIIKPLTAAIAMSLAPPLAWASSPTANQLPGQGNVVVGGSDTKMVNGTLTVDASSTDNPVIIQWGGNKPDLATLNAHGTPGFNIGKSATLKIVKGQNAPSPSSLLNIDASGNPSELLGELNASGLDAPVFVANANGIVVGSGAVIDAPHGLGLVNADLTSKSAQAAFESGEVPISFAGAEGGVTIEDGANLSGIGKFILVAGADHVNVAGSFVPENVTSVVDAGVGGDFTFSGSNTPDFQVIDGANSVYQDSADSAVTLNLGNKSSAYDAANLKVYSDGNIQIGQGSYLNNVQMTSNGTQMGTFDWSGTLVNEGTLTYNSMSMSMSMPMTMKQMMSMTLEAPGDIYNNTNTAEYGGLDNETSGVINTAGNLLFQMGSSFENEGSLNLQQMKMSMGESTMMMNPMMMITVSKGNIDLGGTVDVMGMGSMSMPSSMNTMKPGLGMLMLMATTVPGQEVYVHTSNPLYVYHMPMMGMMSTPAASIDATHAIVDSSIAVMGMGMNMDMDMNSGIGTESSPDKSKLMYGNGNFLFEPFGGTSSPVFSTFTLGHGANITAQNIWLGRASMNDSSPGPYTDITSYRINGSLDSTGSLGSSGNVVFGGDMTSSGTGPKTSPGTHNFTFNVTGSGSITAGTLIFNNLLGEVSPKLLQGFTASTLDLDYVDQPLQQWLSSDNHALIPNKS